MSSSSSQQKPPAGVQQRVPICRAADVGKQNTGQTEGMVRKSALVGVSDKVRRARRPVWSDTDA